MERSFNFRADRLAALTCPAGKRFVRYCDTKVPGLTVRVWMLFSSAIQKLYSTMYVFIRLAKVFGWKDCQIRIRCCSLPTPGSIMAQNLPHPVPQQRKSYLLEWDTDALEHVMDSKDRTDRLVAKYHPVQLHSQRA